ncbi:MAG: GNAT family N-acetyltransferase [Bacilli bacterium]|nr:GNAT family N-acetyltransferase [Bacilli bacterium]
MEKEITRFGDLTEVQKLEAVELFLIGFGHFMTFSKNEEKKKKLFLEIFDPDLFVCYLQDGKVLGLMGLGNNKTRPIDFKKEICQKYFGKFKGFIVNKQMNAIFQKPAVSLDSELYLDTLVTDPSARNKGIGTTLINEACSYGDYERRVTEVFSKNENAIKFYKKNGFIVKKENKGSMMRMFGSGYPITMTKQIK